MPLFSPLFNIVQKTNTVVTIIALLENNIVKDVVNTSSNSTNYMWDGWDPEFLKSLKGKTEKEVDYIMETLFDDWDDEHRTPFVIRGDQTLVR